ncbi:MAG: hypothetical protein GY793_07820 [Proteobacteria bacterium]|nr:hypothetical protein [Pseudomonadota bacterium]
MTELTFETVDAFGDGGVELISNEDVVSRVDEFFKLFDQMLKHRLKFLVQREGRVDYDNFFAIDPLYRPEYYFLLSPRAGDTLEKVVERLDLYIEVFRYLAYSKNWEGQAVASSVSFAIFRMFKEQHMSIVFLLAALERGVGVIPEEFSSNAHPVERIVNYIFHECLDSSVKSWAYITVLIIMNRPKSLNMNIRDMKSEMENFLSMRIRFPEVLEIACKESSSERVQGYQGDLDFVRRMSSKLNGITK